MLHRRTSLRLALGSVLLLATGLVGTALAGGGGTAAGPTLAPVDVCKKGVGHGKWNLPNGYQAGFAEGGLVTVPGHVGAFKFEAKLVWSPTLSPLPPNHGSLSGTLTPVSNAASLSAAAPPKHGVTGQWKTSAAGNGTFEASIHSLNAAGSLAPTVLKGKLHGVFSDPPVSAISPVADTVGAFKCKWKVCP